jgi:hypothetical protein
MSESPKPKIREELGRIEENCDHSGKSHFNAHDRWNRYHYWLGLPSVGLSAIAGIAFFNEYPLWGGILSSTVAILTALSTFLKPFERAASHKSSGDLYLALKSDARVFRTIKLDHTCDDQAAIDGLDELVKRQNEMNKVSNQFSNSDFKKAKKGIDAGESAHRVDTTT